MLIFFDKLIAQHVILSIMGHAILTSCTYFYDDLHVNETIKSFS